MRSNMKDQFPIGKEYRFLKYYSYYNHGLQLIFVHYFFSWFLRALYLEFKFMHSIGRQISSAAFCAWGLQVIGSLQK